MSVSRLPAAELSEQPLRHIASARVDSSSRVYCFTCKRLDLTHSRVDLGMCSRHLSSVGRVVISNRSSIHHSLLQDSGRDKVLVRLAGHLLNNESGDEIEHVVISECIPKARNQRQV